MEVTSPLVAMALAWTPYYLLYALFYLVFVVPPLFFLRQRSLDETPRAIWALAIVSAPIIGAVAFVILQPDRADG